MPDDRPTISSSRVGAADVARHSFAVVRRGFDPQEVRSFLELVARELQAWEQHEEDLRDELAEAEERSKHPVIDEATLTSALGQQSAAVLRNAHDEAARITSAAEESAATVAREAQQHASDILIRAEASAAERIAVTEIAASGVQQQARQEVAVMLDAARAEGEALVERARQQGRAMIDQAQEARRRVLADMAQRRRAITLQIEQFRAARDELAATVLGLRDTVDRVVGDLVRADDDARAAAAEVARRQPSELTEATLVAEVERAAAELDGSAVAIFDVEELGPLPDRPAATGSPVEPTPAWSSTGPGPETADTDETVLDEAAADEGDDEGDTDDAAADQADTDEAAAAEEEEEPDGTEEGGTGVALIGETLLSTHTEPVEVDAVEDLFARLRASRPTGVAGVAEAGVAEVGVAEVGVAEVGVADAGEETPAAGVPVTAEAVEAEDGEIETVIVDEAVTVEVVVDAADEDGPDAVALARRAELLDPIVTKLARRLKRALQDDQNRLLDELRNGSGDRLATVLLPEEEQRALYEAAATPDLREAAVAGIAFGRGQLGSTRGRPPGPDEAAVARVAAGLAGTVVTLLRRRLVGGEGEEVSAGADAADRVGAAYREWRGVRIERLVGDVALEAFSTGVLSAAGTAGLRWVLAGGGTGCADCDDNALAGVVGRGEEFPTGHRHPPAHAGCRCLVVPTPA